MKKSNEDEVLKKERVKKSNFKMKFCFLMAFFMLFQLSANSVMSQKKMEFNYDNVPLKRILNEITSQTSYRFFYNVKEIDVEQKISISVDGQNVREVLNKLAVKANFNFRINENQIVLTKKKVTTYSPQDILIEGTVQDESGTPLPGASMVEKGTTNGTQSDFDGNFSLELSDENAILTISYIGFGTKEVPVNGQSTISVVLEESAAGLDEVVVVGYGTQTKKDLTGSVSVVEGDEIASRSTTNVSNALQGSVAGVSISRSSSAPGSSNDIRIRGVTTLQGASSPLILVDNVPVGSIDDVNPDQVASISILKDGAAASIYGSRAAAGVILITTKRAKTGVFSLGYSGEYIINTPTELRGTVGAIRYMRMDNEKSWNDNGNDDNQFPIWSEDLITNYNLLNAENPDQFPDTDWRSLNPQKIIDRLSP